MAEQRAAWQSKPLLREVYLRAWEALWRCARPGLTVEVGSGSGNFADFLPSAITSDLAPRPWLRLAADACDLPFRAGAVDNIVCTDVVHHLPDPVAFLREATRVLRPDGRLLLVEPLISLGSYPVFRFIHHEPVDLSWSPGASNGCRPNEAIPTLLFFRARGALQRLAPELELIHAQARDWLVYPLSGGYGYPSLLPRWLAGAARRVEDALPLGPWAGFRMAVALRRREPGRLAPPPSVGVGRVGGAEARRADAHPHLSPPPSRGRQTGRRRAWPHWPAALLLLVVAMYWITWFGRFEVPAPDFFEYEHAALAIRAGRVPEVPRRPPLYPALIAAASAVTPGSQSGGHSEPSEESRLGQDGRVTRRPALIAAEVINFALGLAALALIYALCQPLIGRWALLVAWLTAIHWAMAYVVIHPLADPTLLVCVLAALYLAGRASPWRWVAASLAALARYDGFALIAALAFTGSEPRWRRWACAAAAAAPALAYLAADLTHGGSGDLHWQAVRTLTPAGVDFVRSVAIASIGFAPVALLRGALAGADWAMPVAAALAALVAGLAGVGAWAAGRSPTRGGWLAPMAAFSALYVALHLFYPAANTRFVLPVLWFYHFLAVSGGLALARALPGRQRLGAPSWAGASVVACAVGLAGSGPGRWWAFALALPLGAAWAASRRPLAWGAAYLCAVGGAAGGVGLTRWYLDREATLWGEVKAASQWYAAAAKPGDRLLCQAGAAAIMSEYAPLHPEQFLDAARFACLPPNERAAALRRAGATHALWCSTAEWPVSQRGQVLVGSRYSREAAAQWGRGADLLDAIKAGRLPGWLPCATLRRGREVAYVFRVSVGADLRSAPASPIGSTRGAPLRVFADERIARHGEPMR